MESLFIPQNHENLDLGTPTHHACFNCDALLWIVEDEFGEQVYLCPECGSQYDEDEL